MHIVVWLGGTFGENFIAKHLLPLLKGAIVYCTDPSQINKPEPQQSWNSLALIDCLSTLDGLILVLSVKSVLKEFIQVCVFYFIKIQIGRKESSDIFFGILNHRSLVYVFISFFIFSLSYYKSRYLSCSLIFRIKPCYMSRFWLTISWISMWPRYTI